MPSIAGHTMSASAAGPWNCAYDRTYSGMGVNDEMDRGFRVWALDTVEVKNDLIW